MRDYTYLAADFDHDEDAINHIYYMKNKGQIYFKDAHEIQQSYDTSLACSIKHSLKFRMDNSYRFVLIVGEHTKNVTKGGCQLCGSYNSYLQYCAKGHSVDYRSYVRYECEKAIELGLQIIVLYKGTNVNRELCPDSIKYKGNHFEMCYRGYDGKLYWNDNNIITAFRG